MHSSQTSVQHITAQRLAALSRVGAALMSERDETRLFRLIVETARDLIGATFAALTLRPVNAEGEPLVPSEGHLFQLAAIVGVPPEQEAQLRRMPLGGEGLLLPIFHHGVPVRIADAFALIARTEESPMTDARAAASQAAAAYVHGHLPAEELRAHGVPPGHPIVRSFLGAPVLDRSGEVRGGLLLGHSEPGQFTHEDEIMLAGLAAQAAVALENVRWYQTAQMRAQELEATFESIADGVTLVDPQGKVLRENGAARQLRERLRETLSGERTIEALLATPARGVQAFESVQESTVRVDDTGGETREYLVTASPLRLPTPLADPLPQEQERMGQAQGSMAGAVVVWRDVTEARRRLVEQRVHIETEARRVLLQRILDELPSSVYLVRGQDARLVLANRATTAVFGATWRPGQSMRKFLEEHRIRVCGPDGRSLPLEQFATLRALQHGETVLQHQEAIHHPDGTALPVLVNAVALDARNLGLLPADTAVRAAEEAEPAALVMHQDVTALKEAEQLKDEFISIAAHELRTPLAILTGFVQTLLNQTARGKGPQLAEWQQKSLQGIDLATDRLVDLAEDLLDVTRVQAERLELQREPTDLVALARRLLARRQLTTERHALTLVTTLPHLVVHADPRRIEQVLSNLIGNAIKYSPEGGAIEVTIGAGHETHEALLSVRDQGIGIPLHEQAQVFRRFARAANAQAYGIRGTGLGLYLCRELVEQHGGRIWLESAEGQGSTFFVALPLALQAAPTSL
ncbi:MAG: ATP-binding protein [Ktedonobacteraceae bacterium]